MAEKPEAQPPSSVDMRVRHEGIETRFTSQFVVNSTREEIVVNSSFGRLVDPQSSEQILPINNRTAMTPQGAAGSARTLTEVIKGLRTSSG